jgi:hypothetical protein
MYHNRVQIPSVTTLTVGLSPAFMLVFCSAYSTLKMEAIYSSEMSVDSQRTTRRYIPEDNHRCENIKSCILMLHCEGRRLTTDVTTSNWRWGSPAAVICLSCTHLSAVFPLHSVLLLVACFFNSVPIGSAFCLLSTIYRSLACIRFQQSIDLLREFTFNDLSISCEY